MLPHTFDTIGLAHTLSLTTAAVGRGRRPATPPAVVSAPPCSGRCVRSERARSSCDTALAVRVSRSPLTAAAAGRNRRNRRAPAPGRGAPASSCGVARHRTPAWPRRLPAAKRRSRWRRRGRAPPPPLITVVASSSEASCCSALALPEIARDVPASPSFWRISLTSANTVRLGRPASPDSGVFVVVGAAGRSAVHAPALEVDMSATEMRWLALPPGHRAERNEGQFQRGQRVDPLHRERNGRGGDAAAAAAAV
eukprot:ctg_379.g189